MRKVILSTNVTLDGFIEGPNGELDWMAMDGELWADFNDLQNNVDTVLFGRAAYQGFAAHWPAVAANPASPKYELDFARWLERTPKLVFSKTLGAAEWKNSRLVTGNLVDEIANLRQRPGRDLLMFGGGGIASTFMKLGLIDGYRINVFPVILGAGIPLFKDLRGRIHLQLLNRKTYQSGVVGLQYREA
jgi:dihydrofolate reductase